MLEPATPEQVKTFTGYFMVSTYGNQPSPKILYNSETHAYSVESGNVTAMKGMREFPLQLETITGNLNATAKGLKSLKGGPTWVGGYVNVSHNPLTNLDHAPAHVGAYGRISYSPQLRLLRLLVAQEGLVLENAPQELKRIMEKYKGQGKKASLNCALELKKAGFAENARW